MAIDSSDQDLLGRVREGDAAAFGELYAHHSAAAHRAARRIARDPHVAEDLVSESFVRVFSAIQRENGPRGELFPYLLVTMRNVAATWGRDSVRVNPVGDDAAFQPRDARDVVSGADEAPVDAVAADLTSSAFRTLPSRWRTVLWYLDVEGESAADVGRRMDLNEVAVRQLARRAREGLREAYLTAYLGATSPQGVHIPSSDIVQMARGTISIRRRGQVERHLDTCPRCTGLLLEAAEENSTLRALALPFYLVVALAVVNAAHHIGTWFAPLTRWGRSSRSAQTAFAGLAVVCLVALGLFGANIVGVPAQSNGAGSRGGEAAGAGPGGSNAASAAPSASTSTAPSSPPATSIPATPTPTPTPAPTTPGVTPTPPPSSSPDPGTGGGSSDDPTTSPAVPSPPTTNPASPQPPTPPASAFGISVGVGGVITVVNTSLAVLTNVTVTTTPGNETSVCAARIAPGGVATCTPAFTPSLAQLDAGVPVAVQVTITATTAGKTVTSPPKTVTLPVTQKPALAVALDPVGGVLALGQVLTLPATVTNTGNVTLTGVTVSVGGAVAPCSLAAALAPGATASCSVRYVVAAIVPAITATATSVTLHTAVAAKATSADLAVEMTGQLSTQDNLCLDVKGGGTPKVGTAIIVYGCKTSDAGNQTWTLDSESGQLSSGGLCAATVPSGLQVEACGAAGTDGWAQQSSGAITFVGQSGLFLSAGSRGPDGLIPAILGSQSVAWAWKAKL